MLSMWAKRIKQPGFTIVELLIVIVVIAILAAISIVAYNGIQSRARASAASAALTQAQKKILIAMNDGTLSSYPTNQAGFDALGIPTNGVTYQYSVLSTNPTGYCITATAGNVSYRITESGQSVSGSCAGHSNGSVEAITNLMPNPTAAGGSAGWCARASTGGNPTGSVITGQSTPFSTVTTGYRATLTGVPSTWWRVCYISVPITAGQTYTLSAWGRPSVGLATQVNIVWRNSSNATVSESAGAYSYQSANTWQQRTVTAPAPAGAVAAMLEFGTATSAPAGSTMDMTATMLEQSSELHAYADGNFTSWVWNGTANNASSTGPPL